jgi:hypothetical protein
MKAPNASTAIKSQNVVFEFMVPELVERDS